MFRDGIFESFGDFLDSVKESTLAEETRDLTRSAVDMLHDRGYEVSVNTVYTYLEGLSDEDYDYLQDQIAQGNEEGAMSVLSNLDLRKREPTPPGPSIDVGDEIQILDVEGNTTVVPHALVYDVSATEPSGALAVEITGSENEDELQWYDEDEYQIVLLKKANETKVKESAYVCTRCGSRNTAEVEGQIKCLKCGHVEDVEPGDVLGIPPRESKVDEKKYHVTFLCDDGETSESDIPASNPEEAIKIVRKDPTVREVLDIVLVKESKLKEQDRKEAEQTMQPQEETPKEDAERLSMEDWSDTDKDGKPKRKDKVEYPSKLREPEEKELSQEVKYERKTDPLYLCNECFKTFRANKPICKCGSETVERIGKIKERSIRTGDRVQIKDSPNLGTGTAQRFVEGSEPAKIVVEWDDGHRTEEEIFNLTRRIGKSGVYSESKVKEEKGEVGFLRKVFNVKYTENGKELETRVMGFDETDARKYIEKRKKGVVVTDVQQVGESKINSEGMDNKYLWSEEQLATLSKKELEELLDHATYVADIGRDTDWVPVINKLDRVLKRKNESKTEEELTPGAMKALQGPKLKFNYGTAEDHKKVMEDLSQTNFFKTRMTGTQITLVNAKGLPVTYAMDEDKKWKQWTYAGFVSEEKVMGEILTLGLGESKIDERGDEFFSFLDNIGVNKIKNLKDGQNVAQLVSVVQKLNQELLEDTIGPEWYFAALGELAKNTGWSIKEREEQNESKLTERPSYVAVRNYEDGVALVLKDGGSERILTKYPTNEKEAAITQGKQYAGSWDIEFKDLTETKVKEASRTTSSENVGKGVDQNGRRGIIVGCKKHAYVVEFEDGKTSDVWSFNINIVEESKLAEQEDNGYTTIAKGIEDEGTAEVLAKDKNGHVIQDLEDDKKFAVIIKKE